jgi:hypothetical protein
MITGELKFSPTPVNPYRHHQYEQAAYEAADIIEHRD